MIEYKRNIPIKAQTGRVLRILNPNEKAAQAKKDNERDLAISQSYFDQAPSVQNIIRGVYHWARGSEWSPFSRSEDPDDYKYTAGTLPIVTAPARVAGAVVQSVPRWLNPKAVATTAAIGAAASQVSNRPRVIPISRSVSMASEAPTDTDSSTEANTQSTDSSTEAPQTPNDNNEQNKRGWRDRVADKVSNAIRGKKKSTNPQTPQNSNSPGRVVRRVLWETKGNNFGSSYQWRNWAFRSPLYLGTLRTVGDGSIGKGAGKVVGYGLDQFGKFGAGFLEGINRSDSTKTNITTGDKLSPADSTRISLTKQYEELQKEQENKRLKAKIDSINSAGQNPQQISPEDSVRNAALKRYLDDIQHGKN